MTTGKYQLGGPNLLKVCRFKNMLICYCVQSWCTNRLHWAGSPIQTICWANLPSWICLTSAGDNKVVGGVCANVCISSRSVIYQIWTFSGCSALYLAPLKGSCRPVLHWAQMLQPLWRERGSNGRWQREKLCLRATISGRSETNIMHRLWDDCR